MDRPEFSIIIPVYNAEPYLCTCLDSVLGQSLRSWEVICIDDGSTDESSKILDEYAREDDRFRVVHVRNAGVSAARNRGLEMARGEWVSFIDSDDWVPPYYLQVFHDNKEKADVNFFLADVMKADGTGVRYIMPEVGCTEIDETSSRLLFSLVYNESGADVLGWTWDKFYRLTIINQFKVRFDESISYYEDELFALVVLNHASTFRVMSSSLYRYRALPTGLTASNSVDFARLCDAFCGIGDKMKFGPLKRVAFCQALRWAVMAIRGPRGFRAIGKMANVLRNYSDWLCICGRYGKIKDVINRIPRPVAIGLLSIAKIVGLLRTNVCVRIANQ